MTMRLLVARLSYRSRELLCSWLEWRRDRRDDQGRRHEGFFSLSDYELGQKCFGAWHGMTRATLIRRRFCNILCIWLPDLNPARARSHVANPTSAVSPTAISFSCDPSQHNSIQPPWIIGHPMIHSCSLLTYIIPHMSSAWVLSVAR